MQALIPFLALIQTYMPPFFTITLFTVVTNSYAPPLSLPLTLDVPVHDVQRVQVLETVEHSQEDVLGIAKDKTSSFTVLLEVKEVVAEWASSTPPTCS